MTPPEHPEEVATQVLMGTPLRILKTDGGWSLVQRVEGYLGWTYNKIVPIDRAEFERWCGLTKLISSSMHGFTDQEPNLQSQIVSDIVAGDIFWMKSQNVDFYEVEYPDRRAAFPRTGDGIVL